MDNSITLTMQEAQRYAVIKKLIAKHITEIEAGKMIGRSTRQVRRIKKRVIKEDVKGVIHKNKSRENNRKFTPKFKNKTIEIVKKEYHDFKPILAKEKLEEKHNIKISKETLRKWMIEVGLWRTRPRKHPQQRHVWRERKANYGEMQQFDGSYHKWFEDRGDNREYCLLLAVDDATGVITKAKFDYHEGVRPVFKFWQEYFAENGQPISIYLDKFSAYKINHQSAVDNKDLRTQLERAMGQVGVKLITAHSPQAKGRVERMNGTLQDRLVKELRLANISSRKEANSFLKEKFLPKFNAQLAVVPRHQANLHKTTDQKLKTKLPQIFSIQSPRKIMNDYTIMFKNQFFQLLATQPTTVFKKNTVIMEEHLSGEIKINFKDHYLNYKVLPTRPKKQKNIPVAALTKNKPNWQPAPDHPWRRLKIINKVHPGLVGSTV